MDGCPTTAPALAAIRELIGGKAATAELLGFFVSLLHAPRELHAVDYAAAIAHLDKIQSSFSAALSALGAPSPPSVDEAPAASTVDSPAAAGEVTSRKRKAPPASSSRRVGACRNKTRGSSSCREVRSRSIADGLAWRKYGQKDIYGSKYPRSYYRCKHKFDQGCQATKQVQLLEEDPSMFSITYMEEHTCAAAAAGNFDDMSSLISFASGAGDGQELSAAAAFPSSGNIFQQEVLLSDDNDEALSSVNFPAPAADNSAANVDGGDEAAMAGSSFSEADAGMFIDVDDYLDDEQLSFLSKFL